MQDAKRVTGRGAEGERHAIGVTRMCLRSGTLQLPFALSGRLPEGELLVHDVESDEPVVLWSEPPRRLAGLAALFERHELQVNDQVVLDLQGDELRLSVSKRPRRSRPKVTPSTWVSHRDEPAPTPTSAPAHDDDMPGPPADGTVGRDGRASRDATETTTDTESPATGAATPEAHETDPDAEDDVPRAPRVRPRARDAESHGAPAREADAGGPFSGLMRAARGWFGGRRREDPPSEPREPDWLDAWDDETASSDDETTFVPSVGPTEAPASGASGPRTAAAPTARSTEAPSDRDAAPGADARPAERTHRTEGARTPARTERADRAERAAPPGRSARPGPDAVGPRAPTPPDRSDDDADGPRRDASRPDAPPSAPPEPARRPREPIVRDLSGPESPASRPARGAGDEPSVRDPAQTGERDRSDRDRSDRGATTDAPNGRGASPHHPAKDAPRDRPSPPANERTAPERPAPERPVPEPDTEHGTRPPSTPLWPAWDERPDTWTGDAEDDVDGATDALFGGPPRIAASERARPPQDAPHEVRTRDAAGPDPVPAPGHDDATEAATTEAATTEAATQHGPEGDDAEVSDGPTLPSGVPLRAERFLGGDLRTRLVRFLISPDMPLIAKTEMIAKRFDLDPGVARDMLEDVAEDPPPGLRLTPVREGAWRIERTRS